ncbi:G5 domain-containing protein [Streptococcus danieliae]|uniref:G5 domain-containing protein n=1 Tax=Streptococcus danieliae TaxID=747656 RepID=UPI0021C6CCA3|nr:G5 domain-containing protein [Streptococcus danieliae]MCU0081823.1 G5 domain-containing protein [Streptococcus danieliae]
MNRERLQRFSLRKLSVGLLSTTIGSVFLPVTEQAVWANDQGVTGIGYKYVTEDELTEQEQQLIIRELPKYHEGEVSDYYLVYRLDKEAALDNLPDTGSQEANALLGLGVTAFLIIGLAFGKTRKQKIASVLLVTAAGSAVLATDAFALINEQLAQYNQTVHSQADGQLPLPLEIPGHKYIGYLKVDQLGNILPLKTSGPFQLESINRLDSLSNPESFVLNVPAVLGPTTPSYEETDATVVTPKPVPVGPTKPAETLKPEVPVTPEPPVVVPEVPVTPEPPVVVPEVPVTPEPPVVVPEVPVTPEPPVVVPEVPVTPEPPVVVPEVPVTPEPPVVVPEVPVTPEPPVEVPVTPEPPIVVPEVPVTPEPPVVVPEVPVTPEPPVIVPEVPVTPEPPVVVPEVPVTPEPPIVVPEVPVTPEPPVIVPEVPVTPEPLPEQEGLELRYQDLVPETIYQADEQLAASLIQVIQEGVPGSSKIVWDTNKNELVSETVVVPPLNRIVRVGTKPTITSRELDFTEIRQETDKLQKGQEQIHVLGQKGLEITTVTYDLDLVTGQVTANAPVVEVRPAVDQILLVGTQDVLKVRREELPFSIRYQADEQLLAGSRIVEQEGENGFKEVIWNQSKNELVSEVLLLEPSPRIIRVGTKPTTTTRELDFEEIRQPDSTLEEGQEQIQTLGQKGLEVKTTTYSLNPTTGVVLTNTPVVERIPAISQVILVGSKTPSVTRKEDVPFEVRYQADDSLVAGSRIIDQDGVVGQKEIVWNPLTNELIRETLVQQPLDQLVRVGTQPSISSRELDFEEIRQETADLDVGQEEIQVLGQKGLEVTTVTYHLDPVTGEITANTPSLERKPAINQIVRVGTRDLLETRQEVLPFDTIYQADDSLEADSRVVEQEGNLGTKEVVWNQTKDILVGETIVQPALARIIRVGVKPSINSKELAFEEIRQEDSNLEVGQERIQTLGQKGLEVTTITYSLDPTIGVVTANEPLVAISPAVPQVVFVGTKDVLVTRQEEVPFEQRYQADDNLDFGVRLVEQEGNPGLKEIVWNQTKDQAVSEKQVRPARPQLVRVGTKPVVSSRELDFQEIRQEDAELEKGKEYIQTVGQKGLETRTTTYTVDPLTGLVTTNPPVVEVSPAIDQVRVVGTKEELLPEPPQPPEEDQLETRQEELAFAIRYQADPSLEVGVQTLVQEGVKGSKEILWNQTKNELVRETVLTSPIPQLVRVGTKPMVTSRELDFQEIRQEDATLDKGQEQIQTLGQKGRETTTVTYTLDERTGEVTANAPVVETVPAVDQVLLVGTKDILEMRQEELSFDTVYQADDSLDANSRVVEQEGSLGTKEVVWNKTKNELVRETVTLAPVNRLVRVGTKPMVTSRELDFQEIRQEDATLDKGQEQIQTLGQKGRETTTVTYTLDERTGEVTANAPVVETVPAVDQVLLVGTKDILETRQEELSFETVYQADDSLDANSRVVEQEGSLGTKEVVWNKTKNELVRETVTLAPVNRLVRVGTKPVVTSRELDFQEIRQEDATLDKGQERIQTTGQKGRETTTVTYSLNEKTGEVTANAPVVETVPAVDQVLLVGTKDILETRQEELAFDTVYQADDSLDANSRVVEQEGSLGTKEVVWNKTKNELVRETVTLAPVNRLVRVGTKPMVTSRELDFQEIRQEDATLDKGQERIQTLGQKGRETTTVTYTLDERTGEVTANAPVVETVPAVDQVRLVGTKDILETRQEELSFDTVYQADDSLEANSRVVEQEGSLGTKEVVWNKTKDELVREIVVLTPVNRVIRVGTKPVVTSRELDFQEIRQEDATLDKGQERIQTMGQKGRETTTVTYTLDERTGEVTANAPVVETVPAVNQVLLVGTKDILETRQEELSFDTVYQADDGLDANSRVVEQEGSLGTKEIVWNQTKNELVRETVTLAPVNRLVRVGTKPMVTSRELDFQEIRQEDATLDKGQERIQTTGQKGRETTTVTYTLDERTGEVTANAPVVETVPAVDQVLLVGTRDVLETRQEDLAFDTVYQADDRLDFGLRTVEQEGSLGRKEIVWNQTKDELVRETIVLAPVNRVIRVGTKPTVTSRELAFTEIRQEDPTLEKGKERIQTPGQLGLEQTTVTYSLNEKTGEVTANTPVVETRQPVSQVLLVGTRELVKPVLRIQSVTENDDQANALVRYSLQDPDKQYRSAKALLYKGDVLVKEFPISQLDQPLTLSELDYFTDYTLKTSMTYGPAEAPTEEIQEDQALIRLEYKKIELKDIETVELYEKDGASYRRLDNLASAKAPDQYVVQIQPNQSKAMLLPVSEIREVQKDGQSVYELTLSLPELVQGPNLGAYQSNLRIYVPKTGTNLSALNSYRVNYQNVSGAQAGRDVAYYNAEKLLPFYNKEYIVDQGNRIDPSHKLSQTRLVDVVPMADNRIVLDPNTDKAAINRLMLHYEDNTVAYVPLTFKGDFRNQRVAEYDLAGTSLIYTPESFLDSYQSVIDAVTPTLAAIQFDSAEVRQALGIAEGDQSKNLNDLYLEKAFNDLKANLPQELKKLLAADKAINATDGAVSDKLAKQIQENAVPLLLGMSYLNRWYNINYDTINVKDLSAYKLDFFGNQTASSLDHIIQLGKSGFDNLKASHNVRTFERSLAAGKQKTDLFEYLEAYRHLFLPHKSNNQWLKDNTKAYLVENYSEIDEARQKQEAAMGQKNNKYSIGIYDRLASQSWAYKQMLLPLLTMSEESTYVISNMSTFVFGGYERYRYGKNLNLSQAEFIETMRATVDQGASLHRDYYDFWYRLLKPEMRELLFKSIIMYDGFMYHNPDGSKSWRTLHSPDASIQEFFGPTGRYFANNYSAAYATGNAVFYVGDRLLERLGITSLTHEMTHTFDGTIFFEGNGRREGLGAENFARGLLEEPDFSNQATLALSMTLQGNPDATDRYHAANPKERYQSMDDVNKYVKGMFDVIYLLEYLEGKVILSQNDDVKQKWLRKIENEYIKDRDGNDTHAGNKVRRLTSEEISNLREFTDLIDSDVIARRFYIDEGSVKRNSYYTIALTSPFYAALSNDKGAPGDLMFRRMAYELLAAKGYQAGFLPYVSNMYAQEAFDKGHKTWSSWYKRYVGVPNDKIIFDNIFKNEYSSWADFKKAMYQERIQKAQKLKPITIQYELGSATSKKEVTITSVEQIEELMRAAMAHDIKNIDRTTSHGPASWVNLLNGRIYNAYLRQTQDFRESIFND